MFTIYAKVQQDDGSYADVVRSIPASSKEEAKNVFATQFIGRKYSIYNVVKV